MNAAPSHLPDAWAWATLGDLCFRPEYGWTTKARREGRGLRLLRTTDITAGVVDWASVPYCAEEPEDRDRYLVKEGDILISRAGTVGASARIEHAEPAVFASYLIRFRPRDGVDGRYLAWFLRSPDYWSQVSDRSIGIAVPNVNAKKLASIEVPLAPFGVQRRIVAAIEEHFSRIDAGVEALQRVRRNLKRMREAVLQAAVTGRLVPQDPQDEPAEVLLRRILKERLAVWTTGTIRRRLYREPILPDVSSLPVLPGTWVWATVDQLARGVVDGVHRRPDYVEEGIPFVTVRNLTAGPGISFERLNYVSSEDHALFTKRARPERGDLLLTKDGTLGVVRAVRTDRPFSIFVSVALVKPVLNETTDYLEIALSSPLVQGQMVPKGSGLQHIHLEDLRADCLPLPPLTEQFRIVAEAQRQLSRIAAVEEATRTTLERSNRLRRAVLSHAFVGRLVPQDPSDESAPELLERIRASHDGQETKALRQPRRSRQ